jgi:hypothetical protein
MSSAMWESIFNDASPEGAESIEGAWKHAYALWTGGDIRQKLASLSATENEAHRARCKRHRDYEHQHLVVKDHVQEAAMDG